jgi:hypothetical protein
MSDDRELQETIATELTALGVGKGCWATRKGKKRSVIVSALVGCEAYEMTIPWGSGAPRVREMLRRLVQPQPKPEERTELPPLAELMEGRNT